jgi:hypothetical protein
MVSPAGTALMPSGGEMQRSDGNSDDSSGISIEYGPLISAGATVIVRAMFSFGGVVRSMCPQACASLDNHVSAPNNC